MPHTSRSFANEKYRTGARRVRTVRHFPPENFRAVCDTYWIRPVASKCTPGGTSKVPDPVPPVAVEVDQR